MTAQDHMVRVVAEVLRESGQVTYYDVLAALVVDALETEMGLREEATVDFCDSSHRGRDGEWHYCQLPGDHQDDHENEWVGYWPWDDVDGPRKKRTHRLVTDWMGDDDE